MNIIIYSGILGVSAVGKECEERNIKSELFDR